MAEGLPQLTAMGNAFGKASRQQHQEGNRLNKGCRSGHRLEKGLKAGFLGISPNLPVLMRRRKSGGKLRHSTSSAGTKLFAHGDVLTAATFRSEFKRGLGELFDRTSNRLRLCKLNQQDLEDAIGSVLRNLYPAEKTSPVSTRMLLCRGASAGDQPVGCPTVAYQVSAHGGGINGPGGPSPHHDLASSGEHVLSAADVAGWAASPGCTGSATCWGTSGGGGRQCGNEASPHRLRGGLKLISGFRDPGGPTIAGVPAARLITAPAAGTSPNGSGNHPKCWPAFMAATYVEPLN